MLCSILFFLAISFSAFSESREANEKIKERKKYVDILSQDDILGDSNWWTEAKGWYRTPFGIQFSVSCVKAAKESFSNEADEEIHDKWNDLSLRVDKRFVNSYGYTRTELEIYKNDWITQFRRTVFSCVDGIQSGATAYFNPYPTSSLTPED